MSASDDQPPESTELLQRAALSFFGGAEMALPVVTSFAETHFPLLSIFSMPCAAAAIGIAGTGTYAELAAKALAGYVVGPSSGGGESIDTERDLTAGDFLARDVLDVSSTETGVGDTPKDATQAIVRYKMWFRRELEWISGVAGLRMLPPYKRRGRRSGTVVCVPMFIPPPEGRWRLSRLIEFALCQATPLLRCRQFRDSLVQEGLAVYGRAGDKPVIDQIQTTPLNVMFEEDERWNCLHVREDVEPEVSQALKAANSLAVPCGVLLGTLLAFPPPAGGVAIKEAVEVSSDAAGPGLVTFSESVLRRYITGRAKDLTSLTTKRVPLGTLFENAKADSMSFRPASEETRPNRQRMEFTDYVICSGECPDGSLWSHTWYRE